MSDIKHGHHDGKPWTHKLSSGCAGQVGCFSHHYNVKEEEDGRKDDFGEEEEKEEEGDIPELQFIDYKLNLMDLKLRSQKKSGLSSAFRKKSRIVKA